MPEAGSVILEDTRRQRLKEINNRKEKCNCPFFQLVLYGQLRKQACEMHGCRYDRNVKKTRWTVSKQTVAFLLVSRL